MATKRLKNDKMDLDDDLNFDDFDFDIDGLASKEANDKTSRNPVLSTFKGTIKGASSKFIEPSFIVKTAKNALPEQYGEIFSATDKVAGTISSLYDESVREIKPQLRNIAKKVDRLVPENAKLLKKLSTKFKDATGGDDHQSPSEDQYREQAISNSIAEIFNAQNEKDDEIKAREMAQEKIDRNIDNKRFNTNIGLLTSINEQVTRSTSYTEKVTQAYHKKSLELQFRSYFTQVELLKSTNKYFEVFNKQNDSIVKNTALPEFVKIKNSERFIEMTRTKFMDKIQSGIYGDEGLLGGALKNLKDNAKQEISNFKFTLEQAAMGIEGMETISDSADSVGLNKSELLGESLGAMLGDYLGSKASKYGKSLIKEDSNLARMGHKTKHYMDNLGGTISEIRNSNFIKDNEYGEGAKTWLAKGISAVLGLFGRSGEDFSMEREDSLNTLKNPSIFNEKTQKSITEIIPGLLSRIHREIIVLRTNDKNTKLTTYDFTNNKFVTTEKLAENIKTTLDDKIKNSSFGHNVSRTSDLLKSEQDLTDKQMKKMNEFIINLSRISDMQYTPENIINSNLFKSLDDDTKNMIQSSLDNLITNSDYEEKQQSMFTKSMRNVRDTTPDITGEIELFLKAGYGDILEENKIITRDDKGNVDINKEEYFKRVKDNTVVSSDKNVKTGIKDISPKKALEAIKKTKLYNWFYKSGKGDDKKHTGPMAQDVNQNMGDEAAPNGTTIDLTTMNGMNMAAIQALSDNQEKGNKNIGNNKLLKQIAINTSETVKLLREKGIGFGINTENINKQAKSGFQTVKNTAKSGYRTIKSMLNDIKNSIIDGIYKPVDLYIRGVAVPAMTAELMRLGNYFDQETGNQIFNLRDIKNSKGNIVNTEGEVVLTNRNIQEGLLDQNGNEVHIGFKKITNAVNKLLSERIPSVFKSITEMLSDTKDSFLGAIFKPIDIYVWYDDEPVMLAKLMRQGHYIDKETGKIIRNLNDLKNIKGSVINLEGEVVLTIQDIKDGLKDKDGNEIKLGIEKFTDSIANVLVNRIPSGIGKVKGMITDIKDAFMEKIFKPVDLYIRGETIPAISVRLMRLGHYIDQETGNVILTFKDLKNVKGNIVNKAGEVVLTIQDLANGLLDQNGNEVYLGFKKFANIVAGIGVGAFNKVKNFTKGIYNAVKDSKLGAKLKSLIPGMGQGLGMGLTSDKTHNVIVDIRNILIRHTKIKPRKGMNMNDDYSKEGETINKVKDTIKDIREAAKEDINKLKEKFNKTTLDEKIKDLKDKYLNNKDSALGKVKDFFSQSAPSSNLGTLDPNNLNAWDLSWTEAKKQSILDKIKGTKGFKLVQDKIKGTEIGDKVDNLKDKASDLMSKDYDYDKVNIPWSNKPKTKSGNIIDKAASIGGSVLGSLGKLKPKGGITGALGSIGSFFRKKDTNENIDNSTNVETENKSLIERTKAKAKQMKEDAIAYYNKKKEEADNKKDDKDDKKDPAFNDRDGSGERDGSWKDRLKALAEKAKNKFTGNQTHETPEMRYRSKENIIDTMINSAGAVFSMLGKGISSLLSMGGGLLASVAGFLGLGKGKGLIGGALSVLGKVIKAPFALMGGAFKGAKAIGKGLGKIGAPIVNTISKVKNIGAVAKVARGLGMVRNGLMIGSLLTGGVGSALMATAGVAMTAVSTVLASSVLMGAAAVGLAAYGLYKGYKYITKNNVNEFSTIRLKQYGLTLTDKDKHHVNEILELEQYLIDEVVGYELGKAILLKQKLDVRKIYNIFNIDEKDEERVDVWTDWFQNRFKPFFLTHVTALNAVDNKIKLTNVTALDLTLKGKYIDGSSFENGPYDVTSSPFSDIDEMSTDKDSVDIDIKNLKNKISKELSNKAKKEKKAQTIAPINEEDNKPNPAKARKRPGMHKAGQTNPYGDSISAEDGLGETTYDGDGDDPSKNKSSEDYSQHLNIQNPYMADGPLATGDAASKYIVVDKGVRLAGTKPALLKNFFAMAQEYGEKTGKKIFVVSGYRSHEQQAALKRKFGPRAASPGNSVHEFGLGLDIDKFDAAKLEKLGLMKKYGFTRPVGGEPWHIEPAGIQGQLNKAKKDPAFATAMIEASLFKGGGGYGTMSNARKYGRNDVLAAKLMGLSGKTVANIKAANDSVGNPTDTTIPASANAAPSTAPKLSVVKNNKDSIGVQQPKAVTNMPNIDNKNKPNLQLVSNKNTTINTGSEAEVEPKQNNIKSNNSAKLFDSFAKHFDSSDTSSGLGSGALANNNVINDTLNKSLNVQVEMLSVLKQIAANVSPEQFNQIKEGLIKMTSNETNKPNNRTSQSRPAPQSAINLNRKAS